MPGKPRAWADIAHLPQDEYRKLSKGRFSQRAKDKKRGGPAKPRPPKLPEPDNWRRKRYGITPEEFERLKAEQGGHCALCPSTELFVDHCHGTNRVRGLLCRRCNVGLGMLGDDPERLQKAITYLCR